MKKHPLLTLRRIYNPAENNSSMELVMNLTPKRW